MALPSMTTGGHVGFQTGGRNRVLVSLNARYHPLPPGLWPTPFKDRVPDGAQHRRRTPSLLPRLRRLTAKARGTTFQRLTDPGAGSASQPSSRNPCASIEMTAGSGVPVMRSIQRARCRRAEASANARLSIGPGRAPSARAEQERGGTGGSATGSDDLVAKRDAALKQAPGL